MGRNIVRWLGVAVLVAGSSLATYAQVDTDSASTSAFDVTLSETVRIAVETQPIASTLIEVDLETRYFSLGTFTARVWAITNYQVSGDVDLAGTAYPASSVPERLRSAFRSKPANLKT